MTDQIGRVLSGRYRLIAPVGSGASAQVFLADDVRLRRRVAVKVLHAALADDESFLRRFRAEAQAAAGLSHPNVLAVFDWGEDDGTPYIVTEYLGGGSLRGMLDRGAHLTPSQALLVGLEATRALDYAHRRGLVHRDIKPANLLFGSDGRLRIADFGLARALAEAAWTEPQGAVLGTARYASPEQARGEPVDGRSDLYSLGLVLIEAVTGTVPFAADTTIATLMARVHGAVEVPEALGALREPLARVGHPDPAQRPDARELGVALMARAEQLPRPEPLPLADPLEVPGADLDPSADPDATVLAREGGSSAADQADPPDVDALPWPADLDDHGGRRRRRRWPWVVLVVLLAAAASGVGVWLWTESRTPSYDVPVLVGLSEGDARELVAEYGWRVTTEEARRDGTEPGEVVATRPEVGASLEEGGTLVMVVSLGNTLAPVPREPAEDGGVVGLPLEEATARLDAAGGFVPEVTEEFHEEVPAGVVVAVADDVPAELPKESPVGLVVSAGPEPRTVPEGLAGGTYDAAAATLAEIGLVPTRVEEFSDDVESGAVIGTRPGAGEQAARDSEVEVVVSKGPDVVEVPDVDGSSLDEAIAAIEDRGLTVGDLYGPARGRPFTTDPRPGETVRRGTTVDIYLRRR